MRVALAVVASLVLCASAGATAQATRVKTYNPFDGGNLARTLHFTLKIKGSCKSGSAADSRENAWRCFSGNRVRDPCFSHPKAHSWVACPVNGSPFSLGVVRLKLTTRLPKKLANKGAPGRGNPWAVRLVEGKVCTYLTGATFVFHGKRANYGCARDEFLAGTPDRSQPTWTIVLGTGPKAQPKTASILLAVW